MSCLLSHIDEGVGQDDLMSRRAQDPLILCLIDLFSFALLSTCCITVLDIPGFINRTAFFFLLLLLLSFFTGVGNKYSNRNTIDQCCLFRSVFSLLFSICCSLIFSPL